jgi:hypothetical protein
MQILVAQSVGKYGRLKNITYYLKRWHMKKRVWNTYVWCVLISFAVGTLCARREPTNGDLESYYDYIRAQNARVYIFVEWPHRVYQMSKLQDVKLVNHDAHEMKLRMAEGTLFNLFTGDRSCHVGILIKEDGDLEQVHADIYISKNSISHKKYLFAGYDLYKPHLTRKQEDALIANINKFVKENHDADIAGVLAVWVNRERSQKQLADKQYAQNYYDYKQASAHKKGKVGKKFVCTEWVAVAFGSIGIDLTPKYKFNKLYPMDLVRGGTLKMTKYTFEDWFKKHAKSSL